MTGVWVSVHGCFTQEARSGLGALARADTRGQARSWLSVRAADG